MADEPDAYYEWLGSTSSAAQSINTEYVFTKQPRVVAVMNADELMSDDLSL